MKWVEYVVVVKPTIRFKLGKEYSSVVFAKNPLMIKLEKSFERGFDLRVVLDEILCVPFDCVSPFFYSYSLP